MDKHSSMDTKRMEFIDFAKGIGIILVISSHVYGPFMSWALPCYIPIFYVASGFCTIRPVKLNEKFKKLILPYFLFSIILLIVNNSYNWIDWLGILYSRWCIYPLGSKSNIFLLRSGNAPLWFLTSMFVSFILFWLLQKSNKPIWLICSYITTTYLLAFLPVLLPWSIDTAFLMAIFIFFGVMIRELALLHKINYKWLICLVLLYVAFRFVCGNVNLSVRIYGRSLFMMLPTALLGSTILLKTSCYFEGSLWGRIISKIGRHSLTIFCLHIPFIDWWTTLYEWLHFNMTPPINGFLCIAFIIAVTYPISLFVDKYILPLITK